MRGKRLTEADVAGQRYGRLTVTRLGEKDGRTYLCTCQCDCGATCAVRLRDLRRGATQSCGCYRREVVSQRRRVHGATCDGDQDVKRTFDIWVGMRGRCNNPRNPRYHVYGARGICYVPAWENFSQFLADMGPCPEGYSIEREDNDGPYSPENCYWWPRSKQSMNRQDTIWIRYQGENWCFKRLCEHLQKPYLKTYKRYVMRGWDLVRALDIPEEEKHDLARIL